MPAATNKTVHSGRNLATLEFQLKQAQEGKNLKTKQPLDFRHKLILGHVSMLTDVTCAKIPGDAEDHARRDRLCIITTDRDEHIRISRAPPQAHLIEQFCLGHTEFVSRICLLPDRFVSGGGDDDLFIWSWPRGELLKTIPIRSLLQNVLSESAGESQGEISEIGRAHV